MIGQSEIMPIGLLLKPHGIKGEITMQVDADIDLRELRCIVLDIDGIYVPYFIDSVRPRSSESVLVTISDIDTEEKAQELCGKEVYALRADVPNADDADDADDGGFFLADLVGYNIETNENECIGEIIAYDDSTENVLIVVRSLAGKTIYIPIADEFIDGIDPDKKVVMMDLPEGLIDLN
jgi:16S rRNA processing protein RimM